MTEKEFNGFHKKAFKSLRKDLMLKKVTPDEVSVCCCEHSNSERFGYLVFPSKKAKNTWRKKIKEHCKEVYAYSPVDSDLSPEERAEKEQKRAVLRLTKGILPEYIDNETLVNILVKFNKDVEWNIKLVASLRDYNGDSVLCIRMSEKCFRQVEDKKVHIFTAQFTFEPLD